MDVEEKGVKYADAVSRIQAEAPDPSGKAFSTKALKNLVRHGNLSTLDEGVIDKDSLDAFIAGRKEKAPVAEETKPSIVAPVAEQSTETKPAAKVKDEVKLPLDEELDSDEVELDLASREITDISAEEEAEMMYRQMEEERNFEDSEEVELDLREKDELESQEEEPGPDFKNFINDPDWFDYTANEYKKNGFSPEEIAQKMRYGVEGDLYSLDQLSRRIEQTEKLDENHPRRIALEKQKEVTAALKGKLSEYEKLNGISYDPKSASRSGILEETAQNRLAVRDDFKSKDHKRRSTASLTKSIASYDSRIAETVDGELREMMIGEREELKSIVSAREAKATKNKMVIPGRLGEIVSRIKEPSVTGERTFQNTLSLRGVDELERQYKEDAEVNDDPYHAEGIEMLGTIRKVATVLEKKLGRKAIESLEKSGVLTLDWALQYGQSGGEYSSSEKKATIDPTMDDEQIWSSALHEVGSHHGLENIIQETAGDKGWENFRSMMTEAVKSDKILKEAYERTVADYVEEGGAGVRSDLSAIAGLPVEEQMKNDVFLHEVAARVADYDSELVGGKISQTVMWIRDKIVQWLRKFGANIGITAPEVARLIRGSMKRVAKDTNRLIEAKNLHNANLEYAMKAGMENIDLKNVRPPHDLDGEERVYGEEEYYSNEQPAKVLKSDVRGVTKIISGFQTGADIGGIEAATRLGISTGGHMPSGFRTDEGNRPDYAKKYGALETESKSYEERTKKNVDTAHATIAFLTKGSSGTEHTIGYANTGEWVRQKKAAPNPKKPILVITSEDSSVEAAEKIRAFVEKHGPQVLNIAGHRESSVKGMKNSVARILEVALGEDETFDRLTPDGIAADFAKEKGVKTAVVGKFGVTPFRDQPDNGPALSREKTVEAKKPAPLPSPVQRTPDAPLEKKAAPIPATEGKVIDPDSVVRQKITFPEERREFPVSESLEEDIDRSVPPGVLNKTDITPTNAAPMPVMKFGKTVDDAKKKKRLTKKQKEAIAKEKEDLLLVIDDAALVSDTGGAKEDRVVTAEAAKAQSERMRRDKVRQRLIEEGRFAQTPKYIIEANLEIDKINKKLYYKHFSEVKLYAQYLEEKMLEDIEGDATLRKLHYGMKQVYARIQAKEKAQTLYGGKLSPEARDSFDAAAVEIQAKGIDRVASARLDRETGLQVVAALAQRDNQRSAVSTERQAAIPEAIASNSDAYFLDWAFRFGSLLRSADVTRAATTGQTVDTSLTIYQNQNGEDLGADFTKNVKDLYEDIFRHLESLDVFTSEELDALRLENNSLLDNFVRQPNPARSTTLDTLEGALDALSGEYGGHDFKGALKRFMPIPDISIVGIENPMSEMDEVIARFRRIEGGASELSNSEIAIGMLGMGMGRTTNMNPELKNIFDGAKLPAEFLLKMERAGFITVQKRYGAPTGSYEVLDKFRTGSVAAAARTQTFFKDMDLASEPRTATVYGARFEPFKYRQVEGVEVSKDEATGKLVTMPAQRRRVYDSRLSDFRQIRPGSIFLAIKEDGSERAVVMGTPKPDGSARFYAPAFKRSVKDEATGNNKTIHSLEEVKIHSEEKLTLIPSVWNALQGHAIHGSKSTGKMKYNNFWTTLNAMGAVKSRELMAKVFNDTGVDVRRAGHATIIQDQLGNEALLVSDIVGQHVIHLVSEKTEILPDVADAIAVLRHELGTELAGLVERSVSQENEARALAGVRMVKDKMHKRIDGLVQSRRLNETEAAGLKDALSGIISEIHENISKIHGGKSFRSDVRKVLIDAGILSSEERTDAERKEAILREVMDAETSAEADIRSGNAKDEDGNQEDGGSSFSGLTDSQSLAGELGMASAMDEVLSNMEDVDRAYSKVMGLRIPKDWFFPKTFLLSPLFTAIPQEVSAAFRSAVLFMPRNPNVENSENFMQSLGRFGDKPVVTLSDLLGSSHPGGRSAALYVLSSMSQMSDAALADFGVTKLDVNVAYVEAAQTMALPKIGGGTIALDDLNSTDKKAAMAMLGSAGLYGQIGQSWSITNASTDEKGKTVWPVLRAWDKDALKEIARSFKLVTTTNYLGDREVLDLPTGVSFDAEALALSLARREIPFDIGLAAAGLDPDTRREFSPREAYKHQRSELFLSDEVPVVLSEEAYDKLLDDELSIIKEEAQRIEAIFTSKEDITANSWVDIVGDLGLGLAPGYDGTFDKGFTLHGVRYSKMSKLEAEEEAAKNRGVEPPLKNDVITGLDYQQLLLLHEARGVSSEKIESKTTSRDGRMAMVSIGGEVFPIEYKEDVLTPFGWSVRQALEAEYDSARNDKEIDEKTRKRILAVMEKDLLRSRTITRGEAKKLRDLYKFRTSKKDRKLKFDSEGSIAGEIAKALNTLRSVMRTFLSIPEAEMPGIIMHGPDKDALSMWHSPTERGLLPPEIAGRMMRDSDGTIRSLQNSMGFVGTDGNIHIFPKNHGNAYGQLDTLELVKTLFHELVGHVALPKLLGVEYTGFMESVFRKHIDVNGNLSALSIAEKVRRAEEYVAQMAEQVNSFDKATGRYDLEHIGSVMDHLGSMLMRLIRRVAKKFGMDIEISKMEIRDMLSNAFRGVPIVPKNIVPSAFIPAENIGEYGNFQYYKANIADRFIRNVADSLRSWEMLHRANMRTNEPHAEMSGVMHALRTQKSRIGFLTDVSKELEDKFVAQFKGKDYTQAEVAQLLQALHTEERLELDFDDSMETFRDYLEKKGKTQREITAILSRYQKRHASLTFDKLTGMNMRQARGIIGDFQQRGWITETSRGVYSGPMMSAVNVVLEASRMSLEVSQMTGMLSERAAAEIRDRYRYYIPLPGKGLHGFGEGGGFKLIGRNRFASQIDTGGVVSRGEKPDLIGYAFATLRQRIVEGHINATGKSIADFIRAEMLNMDEHGGYTGNSLQGVFSYFITREEKAALVSELERKGIDEPEMWMIQNGLQDMPDTSQWTIDRLRLYEADMGLIPVFENGKMRYVRIEHEGLRAAYDKLQNPPKMGKAMQFMGIINRWLIGVNTILNPEFILPNMIRDYGAAFSVLSISGHVAGLQEMTGKEFAKQMSPRVHLAVRAIFNHNFRKGAAGLTGEALEVYNYIKEFEESGGKIQWPFMESSVETMNNLRESIAVIQGKGTVKAKAWVFKNKAEDLMRRTSDVFENATRLALFVTARKNGASVEESALLSRGTTVDFDRRGDVGQIFNTLYLFANAGLQGTLVAVRAMKNNPKRAMQFFGAVAALSFSVAVANMFMGGDNDDGEPNSLGIPEGVRNAHLTIMIPFSDGVALKIPMAYGPMSFFWAVGQELANAMFTRRGTLEAAGGMAASLLNNFNPLETAAGLNDSHGWTRLFMPTVVDPFVDIAFEQTAFGSPLMPTPLYDGQPDSSRHWRSVSTISKEATRLLNEFFGGSGGMSSGPLTDYSPETLDLLYDNAAGGLGKFIARSLGLAFAPMTGKEVTVNDIPMVRRFLAGQLNWEDRGRFKSNYEEVQGVHRTYETLKKNVAMAKIPELKAQASRDRDDFLRENKSVLGLHKIANNVRSQVGKIDSQKEALYKSGFSQKEIADRLRVLNDRQRQIYQGFNRRYYEIAG